MQFYWKDNREQNYVWFVFIFLCYLERRNGYALATRACLRRGILSSCRPFQNAIQPLLPQLPDNSPRKKCNGLPFTTLNPLKAQRARDGLLNPRRPSRSLCIGKHICRKGWMPILLYPRLVGLNLSDIARNNVAPKKGLIRFIPLKLAVWLYVQQTISTIFLEMDSAWNVEKYFIYYWVVQFVLF